MTRHVSELVERYDPHVLITGDPGLTPYVAAYHDRVRVFDYVCEVMLQADRSQAAASGAEKLLWRLRKAKFAAFLKRTRSIYDLCILNSREDFESLERVWPAERLRLITNGLDLSRYPLGLETPQPNRLIYPGSINYKPNHDAVCWFADEILPIVRTRVPDAELVVTGVVPPDVKKPEGAGVRFVGFVDDVKRMIASAWATVVPLRLGAGGARFKVLESMALGTPLVSTAIGYEGVAVTDRVNILMAEGAESFAARTTEILTSPALRDEIARGGRALMERVYNWDILGDEFEAEITRLCVDRFGLAA
jgi:glycosyltransferase involved in cell wall biosynthesis